VRSIQVVIAGRTSSRIAQRYRSRLFFCDGANEDSMAALSPGPDAAIEPTRPLSAKARTKAFDRN
jgi:hypothetical protein